MLVTLEKSMNPKINTQNVPLRQNTEEKGRGKGLEAVWGDENESSERQWIKGPAGPRGNERFYVCLL